MGLRLHSAKKYDVQYNCEAYFNYQQDTVNRILHVLAEGDMTSDDEDSYFSNALWGNREKLKNNVGKIILPDPEWEYQEELNEAVADYLKYTETHTDDMKTYLHDGLKKLIELSDESCTDVHFYWY